MPLRSDARTSGALIVAVARNWFRIDTREGFELLCIRHHVGLPLSTSPGVIPVKMSFFLEHVSNYYSFGS